VRILALETTEAIGTVAALEDAALIAEIKLNSHMRSAQSLGPAIKSLLTRAGWRTEDVDLVALTIGPGSFTGLRVGITMAKVFAYAVNADILGVDTLQTVADQSPDNVHRVSVAVDAQRDQVVAGRFDRGKDGWFEPVQPATLMDVDVWLGGLVAGEFVGGPAMHKLMPRIPSGVPVVPHQYWSPTSASVGRLAARIYAAGDRDDLYRLVPRYFRRSAAEEKWDATRRESSPPG
jgi:tRNA threonylcarbamoyladenosine biosynthesis protein TsaB